MNKNYIMQKSWAQTHITLSWENLVNAYTRQTGKFGHQVTLYPDI